MRFRALLAVGAVLFLFAGCAKDRLADSRSRYHSEAERQRFTAEHNLNRLPASDVPLTLNDRVYAWMDYFQGAGRGHFQRYLDRSGRYMKMMRDILKQNGLPQDLIYVAMIESGFNNNAYSRAAAVGPWQFIRGTGSRYDLDINKWEDERRDPVKATWAAARYLRDLYNEFGDWYLAMAGYNAGEGRIREAIANSGSRNFWVIADAHERHLRAETRDYVPKFIAAAIIAKMPQNFGFSLASSQKPLEYDVAMVETQTDLEVIADCAGVSPDAVSDLNPHLVRGATPPGVRNYEINLPRGTTANFKAKYASLPESERVKVVYHRVRRGENVATIAKRYGVSKSSLIAANDISTKHKLRAGTMLVVPRGRAAYIEDNSSVGETGTVRTKKLVTYRVKKMDSVSKIAKKFGVTPAQLKSWNSITAKNPLRAGRTLKIYQQVTVAKKSPQGKKQIADAGTSGGGTKHSIRSGDTLWSIAQRYDMSVGELASMNGLDPSAKIKPGQKIIVKMAQGKTAIEASGDVAAPEAAEVVVKDEPVQGSVQTEAKESPQSTEVRAIAMATASEASPDDIDLSLEETKKAPDKKSVAVTKKYKVKKGDSLGVVARKHGVTVSDIMKWNGIKNPKVVRAGQVLKIKKTEMRSTNARPEKSVTKSAPVLSKIKKPAVEAKTPAEPVLTNVEEPQNEVKQEGTPIKLSDIPLPEQQSRLNYKVKDGDTLWDIARRHKVTIAEIQQWNNLSDPSAVKPGDSLKINTN